MKSTSSPAADKKRATDIWGQIVRARGACESCGRLDHLQAAHIVSRRYARTRTDLKNGLCLCASCHIRYTEWPLEFAGFLADYLPKGRYADLRNKALGRDKVDWLAEVERLKAEL